MLAEVRLKLDGACTEFSNKVALKLDAAFLNKVALYDVFYFNISPFKCSS